MLEYFEIERRHRGCFIAEVALGVKRMCEARDVARVDVEGRLSVRR